jgi:response regulator RpfG family c-di-GMP phosphodiesterase
LILAISLLVTVIYSERVTMKKEIILITGHKDQTDTILSSVCTPLYILETFTVVNDFDPELFLSSRSSRPDCILVNATEMSGFPVSFPKSLSRINRSIPVVVLLPFADPDLLLTLLDNKLFYYILFPISLNLFRERIEEISSRHLEMNQMKDSFHSHPYFSEFRHELLNHITIAKGYIDLLCTSLKDDPYHAYSEKVSESIQKIHSALSIKKSGN